jgi:hypothetical protein
MRKSFNPNFSIHRFVLMVNFASMFRGVFLRSDNAEIIRKIKRLADDAHDLKEDSESLPLAERFGCSLLMDDPSLGSECFR